jgi:hypothetical protein
VISLLKKDAGFDGGPAFDATDLGRMTLSQTILSFLLWAAMACPAIGGDLMRPNWADVSPIFEKRCINCHSELGAAKGLRLDNYEAAMAGGANGAVLLARDASGSELIRRLRGESTPRMPFLSTRLPQEEIDLIVSWIEVGLPNVDAPQ